jgi:hypothetical protein
MRAVLAGAALAVLAVTPTLADYYIFQEPSTKRCRIVEEAARAVNAGAQVSH